MSNLLKKEKGFTLIEIVLVLAIAGLILVIVFLAVSGAQKNRRDTQRKSDNARLLSQVEACASNNNGDYTPCTSAVFASGGAYAPSNFTDPLSNTGYGVTVGNAALPACSVPSSGTSAAVYVQIIGRQVTSHMCLEQGNQDLKNF